MKQYLELTKRILKEGRQVDPENARTASGYRSIIGTQMHFNLLEGFPIVTTKYTPFRLIIEELLFFIRGDTNNNRLTEKNVHIWDRFQPVQKTPYKRAGLADRRPCLQTENRRYRPRSTRRT